MTNIPEKRELGQGSSSDLLVPRKRRAMEPMPEASPSPESMPPSLIPGPLPVASITNNIPNTPLPKNRTHGQGSIVDESAHGNSLTIAVEHVPITHVISLERFSSHVASGPRKEKSLEAAKNRVNSFLKDIHKIARCNCNPVITHMLFNGLKSNMDPSAGSAVWGVKNLGETLRKVNHGQIVIVLAACDGFTTNPTGFAKFFADFRDRDITMAIGGRDQSGNDTMQLIDVCEILEVIEVMGSGGPMPATDAGTVVDTMVKASLNKIVMSMMHENNLAIGIGNGRNTYKSTEALPYIVLSSTVTNDDGSVQRLVPRPSDRQNKGKHSVTEYQAVMDDVVGRVLCPHCDDKFSDISDLCKHLCEATSDNVCVICDTQFQQNLAKSRIAAVKQHIDRHFPDRFPCGGKCGDKHCRHVACTPRDLEYHNDNVNHRFECENCDAKFPTRLLFNIHFESAHLRKDQIIEFATNAGYDVGVFGTGDLTPWMKGPRVRTSVQVKSGDSRVGSSGSEDIWDYDG